MNRYKKEALNKIKESKELKMIIEIAGMSQEIENIVKELEAICNTAPVCEYFDDIISNNIYALQYAIIDAQSEYCRILDNAYEENKWFEECTSRDENGYYFN